MKEHFDAVGLPMGSDARLYRDIRANIPLLHIFVIRMFGYLGGKNERIKDYCRRLYEKRVA